MKTCEFCHKEFTPRPRPGARNNIVKYCSTSCRNASGNSKRSRTHGKWVNALAYGLTSQDVESMLIQQDGLCAICNRDILTNIQDVNVDHDHATGRPRGLLCSACNKGLGFFRDNAANLDAAARYIRRYAQVVEIQIVAS